MIINMIKDDDLYYFNEYNEIINNRLEPYDAIFPHFDTKYKSIIAYGILYTDIFLQDEINLYSLLKSYDYNFVDIYNLKQTNEQPICRFVHTDVYGLTYTINFKNILEKSNKILQKYIANILLNLESTAVDNFIHLLNSLYDQITIINSRCDQIDIIKNINVGFNHSLHLLIYNIIDIFFKELDKNKTCFKKIIKIMDKILELHNDLYYYRNFEKYANSYNRINISKHFNPYKNKNFTDCIINCKNINYIKYFCSTIETKINASDDLFDTYDDLSCIFSDLTYKLCIKFNLDYIYMANVKNFIKFINNRKYANLAKILYDFNILLFRNDISFRICNNYMHKNMHVYSYIYFYFLYSNRIGIIEISHRYNSYIVIEVLMFYAIFNKLLNIENYKKDKYDKHKYFLDGINSKFANKLLIRYHTLMMKHADSPNNTIDIFNMHLLFSNCTNFLIKQQFEILPIDSLNYNYTYRKIMNHILYDNNYIETIEYKIFIDYMSKYHVQNVYHTFHTQKMYNNYIKDYYPIYDMYEFKYNFIMHNLYFLIIRCCCKYPYLKSTQFTIHILIIIVIYNLVTELSTQPNILSFY